MNSAHEQPLRNATRWLAGAVWLVVVFVLGAYAMTRPEMWPRVFSVAALAVGIGAGLLVTRISRAWISVVPLAVFWLGGLLLASQMSNSHGYDGGDWSVAAVVLVGGS